MYRCASPCVTDGTEALPGDGNGLSERTAEDICPPPQQTAWPLEFGHHKRGERIQVVVEGGWNKAPLASGVATSDMEDTCTV